MVETQLFAELVQSCRLLASHQKNPNIRDMLHDLEEEFIQKARDLESVKRLSAREGPPRDGEKLPAATARAL